LDSDDIVSEDYVSELVEAVDKTQDIQLIVANKGMDVDIET
jgi:hypothetical protein